MDTNILSLIEICALKFVGNVDFLIKIADIDVDEKVYAVLKKHASPGTKSRKFMELMSIYSSQYITLDDVRIVISSKTPKA